MRSRCYWVRASDGCEFRAQFTASPTQDTIDALDTIFHAIAKDAPEHVESPEKGDSHA